MFPKPFKNSQIFLNQFYNGFLTLLGLLFAFKQHFNIFSFSFEHSLKTYPQTAFIFYSLQKSIKLYITLLSLLNILWPDNLASYYREVIETICHESP